ncbi:hypothetical protein [Nevskia sp.]|uniref:hypothetical protein n=1 Tax=Nevskia sp. TaxID=1929292 RepID=UPI0025D3B6EA|nr:hypothetical protein [Nevskia sp.]
MNSRLNIAILGVSAWLACSAALAKAPSCDDPTGWQELNDLRREKADQPIGQDIEYLYQYRVFICSQIAAGRLAQPEGFALFEAERRRLVERLRRAAAGIGS